LLAQAGTARYLGMKRPGLKALCRGRGLKVSGTHTQLAERLEKKDLEGALPT
jgi:hypothetical protein